MTEQERIKRLAEWVGWKWPTLIPNFNGDGSVEHLPDGQPAYIECYKDWNPLLNIQDAWMLVEKALNDKWDFHLESTPDREWWALFLQEGSNDFCGDGSTPSLAIVQAIETLIEKEAK